MFLGLLNLNMRTVFCTLVKLFILYAACIMYNVYPFVHVLLIPVHVRSFFLFGDITISRTSLKEYLNTGCRFKLVRFVEGLDERKWEVVRIFTRKNRDIEHGSGWIFISFANQ